MSVCEKILKIALNEQKMFDFIEILEILLEVDKFPCNCEIGCCEFTKFLARKKNFFIGYCLKHKNVFATLKDFM